MKVNAEYRENDGMQLVKEMTNDKTGTMQGVNSSFYSCPPRCPFANGNGCYAEGRNTVLGNVRHCTASREEIAARAARMRKMLPITRVNVCGDIAIHDTNDIDAGKVDWLIETFGHRTKLYTYTHCAPTAENIAIVKAAIARGFTINFSCESPEIARALHAEGVPAVLASDTASGPEYHICKGGTVTRAGKKIQCVNCKQCINADRKKIVVFRLHGADVNKARAAINQA